MHPRYHCGMGDWASKTWYDAGLKFTCTQCGNCCTGSPGYVYVTREEREKIAAHLDQESLTKKQVRLVGLRHSLTEDKRTGDCVFLEHVNGKRTCSIYSVRPLQCRTWPFWDTNLRSRVEWESAAQGCPGMNHGGHYDLVQISIRRDARKWEDVPS